MLTSQEASHARFFNLSLRHAIDIEQVDAFMNRLIGTLRHYEHTGRLHPDGYTADEVLNITFRPARGHQGYAMSAVDAVRQEAEATLRYYEGNMASPAPEQRPALTRINRVKQLTPHTSLNQPHATQGASARPLRQPFTTFPNGCATTSRCPLPRPLSSTPMSCQLTWRR